MLGGHPLSVQLAAPLLEHTDLKGLFKIMLKDDFTALDQNEGISLEKSTQISLKKLEEVDPDAIELFMFLG